MGLDITAYSKATPAHPFTGEWCENDDHVLAFTYGGFEHSYAGLAEPDRRFDFGGGPGTNIGGVCYDVSDAEAHRFAAGSYGGYGLRRNMLSEMFLGAPAEIVWKNPDDYRDKPFYELVNNADNEGVIGPVAAAALAEDFTNHAAEWADAVARQDDPGWLRDTYIQWFANWAKATRLAAPSGLIRLH